MNFRTLITLKSFGLKAAGELLYAGDHRLIGYLKE